MKYNKHLWWFIPFVILILILAVYANDLGFVNGRVLLPETTAPTAIADKGQLWVEADNSFHVQTGDGVDHEIPLKAPDYAGIFVDGNSTVTTINVIDAFERIAIFDTDGPEAISDGDNTIDAITIGASGDYEIEISMSLTSAGNNKVYEMFGFEVAVSGDAISGATQANPCVVTATGHSFSNGSRIKIAGVVGMVELNDRIFTVAGAGANDFQLNDDNGGTIDSTGFTAYGSVGTVFLATKLSQVHTHRKIATGADVGSWSGGGFASLTASNLLELWIKGTTDGTNMTVEDSSFVMKRLD